jgi:hypothetical protein
MHDLQVAAKRAPGEIMGGAIPVEGIVKRNRGGQAW